MTKKGVLIGICGGTCSGKTSLAKKLVDSLGSKDAGLIQQDSYYKNWDNIPFYDNDKRNFDHPEAYDGELLLQNMKDLLAGKVIKQPVYDFKRHRRAADFKTVGPLSIIVLEGILIFADSRLRELMNMKVFVDAPADIRLVRRIRGDIDKRGRTLESVLHQYEYSVRPMHLKYIEPFKNQADIIISGDGKNEVAVDMLKTKIDALLGSVP